MDNAKLIDLAANKVGGISELARRTEWHKGSIAAIKAGKHPMPANRAAQIAEIIGTDPKAAYLEALKNKAESDYERSLLGELLRMSKSAAKVLTIAVVLGIAVSPSDKAHSSYGSETSAGNIHYDHCRHRQS